MIEQLKFYINSLLVEVPNVLFLAPLSFYPAKFEVSSGGPCMLTTQFEFSIL